MSRKKIRYLFLFSIFFVLFCNSALAQESDLKLDEGESTSTLKTSISKSTLPSSERKRSSTLGLSLTKGDYNYKSASLEAGYGVNTNWLIDLSYDSIKNTDGTPESEFRFGLDGRIVPVFSARLHAITKNEPNDISGKGLSPGFTYELSSLWEPLELFTTVSVDVDFIRYNQKSDLLRIKNRNIGNSYNERKFEIKLTQDLTEKLSMNLDFTKYTYGKEYKSIFNSLGNRTTQNTNNNFVNGYTSSIAAIGLDFELQKNLLIGTSLSNSRTLGDHDEIRGLKFFFDFTLNDHWSLEPEISLTKSKISKTNFNTLLLGMKYFF